MTTPELEDALVEFIAANTYELRYPSNIETNEKIPPHVYCAFIPRNVVGEVIVGEITTYPAVIVRAREGVQQAEYEQVTVELLIGVFDPNPNQQGSRDCLNIVERIKQRLREQSIVRERFPIMLPLTWQVNKRISASGSAEYNAFPYYFAEMQLTFKVPTMGSQYEADYMSPEVSVGRLNSYGAFPRATPAEKETYE